MDFFGFRLFTMWDIRSHDVRVEWSRLCRAFEAHDLRKGCSRREVNPCDFPWPIWLDWVEMSWNRTEWALTTWPRADHDIRMNSWHYGMLNLNLTIDFWLGLTFDQSLFFKSRPRVCLMWSVRKYFAPVFWLWELLVMISAVLCKVLVSIVIQVSLLTVLGSRRHQCRPLVFVI